MRPEIKSDYIIKNKYVRVMPLAFCNVGDLPDEFNRLPEVLELELAMQAFGFGYRRHDRPIWNFLDIFADRLSLKRRRADLARLTFFVG